MGSGEKGDYRKHKKEYENIREYRQFCEEAAEKDLVVLKRPRGTKWAARAVGKITSGYSFESVFSDVEDFSLQHCRQVEWKEPDQVKPVPGLSRGGGTFSHVNDERAREVAERLWKEGKRNKPEAIPHEPEELSPRELTDSLTAEGLPRERAKCIAKEIEHLQQLADWYDDVGWYDVGEHEARTFLVVPLIKSLGWDEKQVRIEWHYKDVVLFDSPYSQKKKSKPLILIETKRLGDGLSDAPEQQAKDYAKSNPTCDRLVVTDGIRYKLFTKPKPFGGWSLSHYLNICSPTRAHRYDPDVAGAVSFLLKMLPKGAM